MSLYFSASGSSREEITGIPWRVGVQNSHEINGNVVTNSTVKSMIDFWFEDRITDEIEKLILLFAIESIPKNQQFDQFICQRDPN